MRTTIILILIVLYTQISPAQLPICDFQGKDSLLVRIVGDTINIWDVAVCANCGSRFTINVYRSADSLYIMQVDTSHIIFTCDCIFNLNSSIIGIPTGTYTAVIYRDWHIKIPQIKQPIFIKAIQFEYNPQRTPNFSYNVFQSACGAAMSVQNMTPPLEQFNLLPNYPNPFNPSTTICFQNSRTEFIVIKIFDILGREVQTLLSEVKIPGLHSIVFNAPSKYSSGIYYYRMYAGSYSQSRMMILLR